MPVAHLHTEIALDKKGTAPVEMQLLPPGEPLDNGFSRVSARDGRSFTVPAHEQLVAAFTRKIPIDVGHLTQLGLGAESGAVGWIHGLEARETGLWAVGLEWLNDGREHVETKRFARQSPTLGLDPETGFVSMVLSAALTNDPALTLVELAERQKDPNMTTPPNPLIAHLCSELRIPMEGANVGAVLAAARTGYVPEAELCKANARADQAEAEVANRDHELFSAKGLTLIGTAVKDGRVTPAERDYYLSMCTSEEGLSKTEAHLATLPKRVLDTATGTPGAPPDADSEKCPDRIRAMCKSLKIDPDEHWARVRATRNT